MTAGRGDPELLDDLVGRSLGWLTEWRDHFRLPPDATTDADPNLTLKPLGELAELTQLIASCHPRADFRAAAQGLFAFAWREAREGELFAELIRGEPHATYPVEIYGAFAQAGLRHPTVEELVLTTTGLRGWRVAREDHTRTLGVLNAERRIGLPQHAAFDPEFALTGLGLLPEPWALDRKAAYGVTHDVFHLTDWGRNRRRLTPEAVGYLRLWLPSWLENWLEEQLWDLVGELLAVAACLPSAPYDAAAWRRLAGAQAADGGVPETGAAPRPDDPTEAFRACYHSTLVTAFAGTLARIASEEAGVGPVPVGDAAAVAGRTPCESEAAL
ncbi:DUF6895 family protein [Streptomyces sp. NPDC090442]|uniref:DUF6895 family protein n=1 Tax=Streptomyces sp. NPDC090442 TaxID=3365962 RepID=UPI003826CAC3